MLAGTRSSIAVAFLMGLVSVPAAAGDFCDGKTDGRYAHPDDCSQHITCEDNGAAESAMDCPVGLLWNDDGQTCDWPENGTCSDEALSPDDDLDAYVCESDPD